MLREIGMVPERLQSGVESAIDSAPKNQYGGIGMDPCALRVQPCLPHTESQQFNPGVSAGKACDCRHRIPPFQFLEFRSARFGFGGVNDRRLNGIGGDRVRDMLLRLSTVRVFPIPGGDARTNARAHDANGGTDSFFPSGFGHGIA